MLCALPLIIDALYTAVVSCGKNSKARQRVMSRQRWGGADAGGWGLEAGSNVRCKEAKEARTSDLLLGACNALYSISMHKCLRIDQQQDGC